MSRILIPRSDSISAKNVSASDWEKYFFESQVLFDYVVTGMALSAGGGLSVDVGVGIARVIGLHCEITVSAENLAGLTANNTNHIYIQINRDGNIEPESFSLFANTVGGELTDKFKIGTATTNATIVTATDITPTNRVNKNMMAFVGTGAQISGLSDTWAGMKAFCTVTGSGFRDTTTYVRNAANTAWRVDISIDFITWDTLSTNADVVAKQIIDKSRHKGYIVTKATVPQELRGFDGGFVFYHDFSDYANDAAFDADYITSLSTLINNDAANDEIDYSMDSNLSGAETRVVADVFTDGETIMDDEKWAFRCLVDIDTLTQGADSSIVISVIGFGNNITSNPDIVQDYIGLGIEISSSVLRFVALASNNTIITTGRTGLTGVTPTAGTTVGYEIRRTSATEVIFQIWDATFENKQGNQLTLTIAAAIDGLNFFKIWQGSGTVESIDAVSVGSYRKISAVNKGLF